MKKLLVFFLAVCTLAGCKQRNGVTFDGTISGADGLFLTISRTSVGQPTFTDSVRIQDGHFRLTLPAEDDNPSFYNISLSNNNAFTTLASKGESVIIEADAASLVRSYRATGSPDAERMCRLDRQLALFADSIDHLMMLYDQHADDDSLRKAIEQSYLKIKANHQAFLLDFIAQNNESLSCLAAFYQRYNQCVFLPEKENIALLQKLYEQWKVLYPNSIEVQWTQERLARLKEPILYKQPQETN